MRIGVLLAVAFCLGSCATAPPMSWLRTDGRPSASDPVLAQQFQLDKTICLGEREKADLSGVSVTQGGIAGMVASQNRSQAADAVAQGCMAEKGYVLVRQDEAAAKAAEFAAVAAEKQAEQALPPPAASAKPAPKKKQSASAGPS